MLQPNVNEASTEERWDRSQFNLIGIVLFGMTTLSLFMVCLVWKNLGSPWGPMASAVFAFIFFAAHLLACRGRLSAMDPLVWVPVFILLFYFGTPVAVDLMGFRDYESAFAGAVPSLRIAYAVNLLDLVAFFFGVQLAGVAYASRPTTFFPQGSRSLVAPALAIGLVGYFMILIGMAIAGPSLLFGYYGDLKLAELDGTATTSWFNVGVLVVPAACMALMASYDGKKRWIPNLALFAMAPVAVLLVLIGDRGGLAAQLMAVGWVYTQRYKRLPLYVATIGFVVAVILMPIIKEYRNYRNLQDSVGLSPYELVAATLYETGSSGMVFAWTMDAVPKTRPYDYGLTIALPLAYLVPWIGRAAPGLGDLSMQHNPNFWISEHIDPASYEVKGAHHGFTMTGVWYSNFGVAGVLFFGTLTGWIVGRLRNMARETPLWLTASGLMVVCMALFVRNSLGVPLRFAVWPFALLLIAYYVFPRTGPRTVQVENTDSMNHEAR